MNEWPGWEELSRGSARDFEELALRWDGFPCGCDSTTFKDPWIIGAIQFESPALVEWMISRGVDLTVRDANEDSVLHVALDRDPPERYDILNLLLRHGAPVNGRGFGAFQTTPAHAAAYNDDLEALRMLVRFGADLSLKTSDFDGPPETPFEYARSWGRVRVVEFLEQVVRVGKRG